MRIVFHPNDGGGRATLLISDNAENSPQRVALYGQTRVAVRGLLQVESYNPDFGRVPVGTYSVRGVRLATATPSQRIVLRNAGSGNLGITQIKPPSDASYTVKADCPRTLAPSATCVVLITFQPSTVGLHPANVVIENDGSTGDAMLSFQGEGINPYSKVRVSQNSTGGRGDSGSQVKSRLGQVSALSWMHRRRIQVLARSTPEWDSTPKRGRRGCWPSTTKACWKTGRTLTCARFAGLFEVLQCRSNKNGSTTN